MTPAGAQPVRQTDDAQLVQSAWEALDRVLPPMVSLRLFRSDRPLTLRECVPVWLRWLLKTRGRSPLTVRYYAEDLRAFLDYCDGFSVQDPRAVSEAVIETYLAALTGRGLKPATVSRPLYALRSFFRYLLRERVVDRDPAATSYGPRVPRRLPSYLTVPEWRRLLRRLAADRSLIGQRDFALIATLVYCGLRVAEVATLRLDALRLDTGWLRVVGKGTKAREVPIPHALTPILQHYLATVRHQLVAVPDSPYVFVANERGWRGVRGSVLRAPRPGLPMRTRSIHRIVLTRGTALLGRRIYPHMLRHSYATALRRAGGDLQLVKELLGHSDIGTTMVYSHLGTEARREEVSRLLGRPPSEPGLAGRRRRKDAQLSLHAAVGERLRQARRAAGLTVADLARKSGAGRSTIIRAERGGCLPSAMTLQRIARATGAEVGWILGEQNAL